MENLSKLTFENHKFIFLPDNTSDAERAKNAALHYDSISRQWVTRNINKAAKLRAFADEKAEIKFKKHFMQIFKRPDAIIYPDHLQPKTYQMASAFHALTRSPAYIADDPGLGKTIISILCMNTAPGRALIICPPYLKYNWQDEIAIWCKDERRKMFVGLFEKGGELDTKLIPDIVIVPDSLLTNENILQYLGRQKFMWGFVDEAHRFKDDKSKRTQALFKRVVPQVDRLVYLSGTPMPNTRPIELWPIISETAPSVTKWASKEEYWKTFCGGKENVRYRGREKIVERDYNGRSHLELFGDLLQYKFMIRHEKRDVLKELPPKTRQIIFLDKPKKIEKYEREVLAQYTDGQLQRFDDHDRGAIATFRRECGLLKIKPSAEFIKDQIEASQSPLIVFAYHIEVVKGLTEALSEFNPITIRGGLSPSKKEALIRQFKSDKGKRPIVGNYDSIGVGLTLTRAIKTIHVEYSWVPGVNMQAEDRIHRMTQTENTIHQYLVMRNSLDQRQLTSVLNKQQDSAKVMSKRKAVK